MRSKNFFQYWSSLETDEKEYFDINSSSFITSQGTKVKETSVEKGYIPGRCCQSVHTVHHVKETFVKLIEKELRHKSTLTKYD